MNFFSSKACENRNAGIRLFPVGQAKFVLSNFDVNKLHNIGEFSEGNALSQENSHERSKQVPKC